MDGLPVNAMFLAGACLMMISWGIGGIILVRHFAGNKQVEASRGWASASGRVILSTVRKQTSSDADGTSTSYYPEVHYSYDVIGRAFSGKRVDFGASAGGSYRSAQEAIEAYPAGNPVTVYYDPGNPAEAVLIRQEGNPARAWLAAGTFIVIGILLGSASLGLLILGAH